MCLRAGYCVTLEIRGSVSARMARHCCPSPLAKTTMSRGIFQRTAMKYVKHSSIFTTYTEKTIETVYVTRDTVALGANCTTQLKVTQRRLEQPYTRPLHSIVFLVLFILIIPKPMELSHVAVHKRAKSCIDPEAVSHNITKGSTVCIAILPGPDVHEWLVNLMLQSQRASPILY
jgi:hypothetical protein